MPIGWRWMRVEPEHRQCSLCGRSETTLLVPLENEIVLDGFVLCEEHGRVPWVVDFQRGFLLEPT